MWYCPPSCIPTALWIFHGTLVDVTWSWKRPCVSSFCEDCRRLSRCSSDSALRIFATRALFSSADEHNSASMCACSRPPRPTLVDRRGVSSFSCLVRRRRCRGGSCSSSPPPRPSPPRSSPCMSRRTGGSPCPSSSPASTEERSAADCAGGKMGKCEAVSAHGALACPDALEARRLPRRHPSLHSFPSSIFEIAASAILKSLFFILRAISFTYWAEFLPEGLSPRGLSAGKVWAANSLALA